MDVAQFASHDALWPVAEQIFDLLWSEGSDHVPTAGDHAYQHVWIQVITGARQPGEHLSDVELAASLGVSRTPVREALHRLVQEGLVCADPRRGFRVRAFTTSDVHEFYDIRVTLETLALRQGAGHISAARLQAQLEQVVDLRGRLAEHPVLAFLQHDFQFHNLIIHASGNGRLIRLLAALRAQVSLFQIRAAGYPSRIATALDGHERVLRALLADHVEEAAALLDEHISHSRDGALEDLGPSPGGGAGTHRRGAPQGAYRRGDGPLPRNHAPPRWEGRRSTSGPNTIRTTDCNEGRVQ